MKKNHSILIVLVILLISTSMTCEDPVEAIPITFKNGCNEPVEYYYLFGYSLTAYNILYLNAISLEYLNPGDSVILLMYPDPLDRDLEIVIFKKSTLDTIPHRKLIEHNMHDAYYRLSREQLKKLNYEIVYSEND